MFRTKVRRIFIYVFGNKPFQITTNFLAAFVLPYLLSSQSSSGTWWEILRQIICQRTTIVFLVIYVIVTALFSLADKMKQWDDLDLISINDIKDELSNIFTCMSLCVRESEHNQITISFEDVAQMVCNSLYTIFSKRFTECEIRVNVTKQFTINNQFMYCTSGYKSCNRGKGSTQVRPLSTCKQYIKTIFDDNAGNYVVMDKEEIQEKLHFTKTKAINKQIRQYIAIPYKGEYDRICFILQIDSNLENTFGKKRDDVERFINRCIWPFVKLLDYAYALDNALYTEGGDTIED